MTDEYSQIMKISIVFALIVTNQVLFIQASSTKKSTTVSKLITTTTKVSKLITKSIIFRTGNIPQITTTIGLQTTTLKILSCPYGQTLDDNSCRGLYE